MKNKIMHVIENVVYVAFVEERLIPEEVMTAKQLDDFNFVLGLMKRMPEQIHNSEWNELIRSVISIDEKLNKLKNNSNAQKFHLRAVK